MNEEENNELLEFEKGMVENFVFRYGSVLAKKNVVDVLNDYVEWRHNRYTVIEDDNALLVMDVYNPNEPIAIFDKLKNPDAFNHAWTMCENMNDLPKEYLSINGRMVTQDFNICVGKEEK